MLIRANGLLPAGEAGRTFTEIGDVLIRYPCTSGCAAVQAITLGEKAVGIDATGANWGQTKSCHVDHSTWLMVCIRGFTPSPGRFPPGTLGRRAARLPALSVYLVGPSVGADELDPASVAPYQDR